MTTLRWGVLSTATIARTKVIPGLRRSERGEVVAIASRDASLAERVASQLDIPTAHGSYEALLADPEALIAVILSAQATDVSVNLATERATITYDTGVTNVQELAHAIEDVGYQVRSETATLPIHGMTCAACAAPRSRSRPKKVRRASTPSRRAASASRKIEARTAYTPAVT